MDCNVIYVNEIEVSVVIIKPVPPSMYCIVCYRLLAWSWRQRFLSKCWWHCTRLNCMTW